MTPNDARQRILAARRLADVTSPVSDAEVRRLRVLVHPDHHSGDRAAWDKLAALADAEFTPLAPSAPRFEPLELRTRARTYRLTTQLPATGAIDSYVTDFDGQPAVARVAGSSSDDDLIVTETTALRAVSATTVPAIKLLRLIPRLLDSFELRDRGGRRHVNIVSCAPTGSVSLAAVRAAYPTGLDFRDAAWMVRRLLGAVGLAHSRGWIHGAVLPQNVQVHPSEHGAHLENWTCAVQRGQPARALTAPREWYPPELLVKRPLGPPADLFMVGRCFAYLLGAGDVSGKIPPLPLLLPDAVPAKIRAFVRSLLIENPARRPDDAWALHDTFGELMCELVGPPTFRVLAMPSASI